MDRASRESRAIPSGRTNDRGTDPATAQCHRHGGARATGQRGGCVRRACQPRRRIGGHHIRRHRCGIDIFRRIYETNGFGVVAAINAFLPALRREHDDKASGRLNASAEVVEEVGDVFGEQGGFFVRCEVAASGHGGVAGDVVGAFRPSAGGPGEVTGEYG